MASRPRLPTPRSAVEPSRQVPGGGEPPGARGSAPSAPPERSTTSVCAAADADRHTNAPRTSADPAMVFMAVPPGFPERNLSRAGRRGAASSAAAPSPPGPRTGELTQSPLSDPEGRERPAPSGDQAPNRRGSVATGRVPPFTKRMTEVLPFTRRSTRPAPTCTTVTPSTSAEPAMVLMGVPRRAEASGMVGLPAAPSG